MSFALDAILFWIAAVLSPPDTSQILVKGPDATWAWTRQKSGWSFSSDRSLWSTEGNTVTSALNGTKGKRDVGQFVKGVKDHDWKKSATLRLEPKASLSKKGEIFVYARDEGDAAEKRYIIRFRRKQVDSPAPAKKTGTLEFPVVPNPAGSPQKPAYPEFVAQTNESFAAAARDWPKGTLYSTGEMP